MPQSRGFKSLEEWKEQKTRGQHSQHARLRRAQRQITEEHIAFCMSHGTRTNVPHDGGAEQWLVKYMFGGLHVVAHPRTHVVVTAYWTRDDCSEARRVFEGAMYKAKGVNDKARRTRDQELAARGRVEVKKGRG